MKHHQTVTIISGSFSNLLSFHKKLKRSVKFLRREITKKLTYSVIIKIIREVMVKNITLGPSEVQPHDS